VKTRSLPVSRKGHMVSLFDSQSSVLYGCWQQPRRTCHRQPWRLTKRKAALIGVLLLGSVSTAAALTDESDDRLKETLLYDPLPALTIPCHIVARELSPPYIPVDDKSLCHFTLKIIVTDFEERSYPGRYYCPPAGTEYEPMFDVIRNHIVLKRPVWTERAVDVALRALMSAYPCKR
jgi:hypothetical protein